MEDTDELNVEAADDNDPDFSPGLAKKVRNVTRKPSGKRKIKEAELRRIVEGLEELGPLRLGAVARRVNRSKPVLKNIIQERANLAWRIRRRRNNSQPTSLAVKLLSNLKKPLRRSRQSSVHSLAVPSSLLSIVALERHPPADQSSVDYRVLYQGVYNTMHGLPLPEMNVTTSQYLVQSMEWLLQQALTLVPRPPDPTTPSPPDNQALSLVLKSEILNPLSLEEVSSYAGNKGFTPGFSTSSIDLKQWLSDEDWANV